MVRIFVVYGGREGEGYATTIRNYFRVNNIDAFLASGISADMHAGADVPSRIDQNLVNAQIAIIVITPELGDSEAAMSEIELIQDQLGIPYVPYHRRESHIPTRLSKKQLVPFDPPTLDDNALRILELEMWRALDVARTEIPESLETESVEVSYIG